MNPTVRGISPIIDGYLAELDAATAHLPADERHEIVTSIEEHIADAAHGSSRISDDEARGIVRDLGPVASIVDMSNLNSVGVEQPAHARPVPRQSATNNSRVAVILATVTTASMFFVVPLSIITGLLAMGFGIVGLRRHEPNRGEAWTAIVCGALPLILMVVLALLAIPVSGTSRVG